MDTTENGQQTFRRDNERYKKVGNHNRTKRKLKKILLIAGGCLLALVLGVAIAIFAFLGRVDAKLKLDDAALTELNSVLVEPASSSEPFYTLIVGSDSRDPNNTAGSRTDTIMLARLDPKAPLVTILSIPRDTEIILDGYGTQKINAAFALEGEAGAVRAVSTLCNVKIAHYVEIDFEGVISLVDILGGVDVVVPVDIELDGVFIAAGPQHLDGAQALIMSRCRSFPTADFQRVVNQRILLQAVVSKVLHASPFELPGLIERLADCVKTDLNTSDAIGLALQLRGMDTDTNMYLDTIPSSPNYHDEVSYVAVDPEQLAIMMERVNNGLSPREPGTDPLTPAVVGSQ